MGTKRRRTKQPKLFTVGDTIPIGPGIEFRHDEDDAWYNVQIVLIADTLIVKFVEFPDDEDVQFHVADFIDYDQIFKFLRRFRPLCLQLEGSDCSEVKLGIRVCAILDLGDNGRRYFDAIVEGVKRKEHTIMDGIENCSCSVVLSWMHGPKAGTMTLARVEDLCFIRSQKQLDPRLACFSELVKWKHGITLPKLITEDTNQISEGEKPMGEALPHDGDILGYESSEDIDLGGGDRAPAKRRQNRDYDIGSMDKEARSFFVVDNLEKDVSPSTISDFIREQTGVEIDAFVFLSLPSQTYTKGALVVDSDEDLEILCNFVAKSDQMITSSKGRPWVVLDSSANESVRPSFWCLEPEHQVKGPDNDQMHDSRDKTSEKFEFIAYKKGIYHFCFSNKSPYHETIDFDVHVGHYGYFDHHAKDEHLSPVYEQIAKLEEALYNIQFEQHWLEAETDRQAIINEGMSQRAMHKAFFESAALIGASVLQVYLLKRLFERKLGTSIV